MKTPDVREATLKALKNARDIRIVGEMASYDAIVLENRATGERRRVPNKFMLIAGKHPNIAFEMVPSTQGFEEDEGNTEE
jgi:hypothetical protein